MEIDILKMIESVEEMGADSAEYKLNYRSTEGTLFEVKTTITRIDEE